MFALHKDGNTLTELTMNEEIITYPVYKVLFGVKQSKSKQEKKERATENPQPVKSKSPYNQIEPME